MTGIPATSDDSEPREWSVSNRTLVVSADAKRVLAALKVRNPLLLPPGSVLQFGDPPGELVVTRIRVMVGEAAGSCAPRRANAPLPRFRSPSDPAERPGRLHAVPSQPPRWSQARSGNG